MKIDIAEWPFYCCIHMPSFDIIWLLLHLCLDGKLCVCDDKICCFCIRSPSLDVAGEHKKRHAMRAHIYKPHVVSE